MATMFDKALLSLPSDFVTPPAPAAFCGASLPAGYAECLLAAAFGVPLAVLDQALLHLESSALNAAASPVPASVSAPNNVYSLNAARRLRLAGQNRSQLSTGVPHE
jgi:hypothetical protein